MIKVPEISAIQFYTRDSFIDYITTFPTVENSIDIIRQPLSPIFKQMYVAGVNVKLCVWTTNGVPVFESNLQIITTSTEILTDDAGRTLYGCSINFQETGDACVELRDADYVYFKTNTIDVVETMPVTDETPSVYFEYSNQDNDFDYYFVNTQNERIYYSVWFQALNIKPITESEIDNFEDSNNDKTIIRAIPNDGFEIKVKCDNRFLRMLQEIVSCKYLRMNGVEYSCISALSTEQIEGTNESLVSIQLIRRKGIPYQAQISVCALTDDGEVIITEDTGESVILNYKPIPL